MGVSIALTADEWVTPTADLGFAWAYHTLGAPRSVCAAGLASLAGVTGRGVVWQVLDTQEELFTPDGVHPSIRVRRRSGIDRH